MQALERCLRPLHDSLPKSMKHGSTDSDLGSTSRNLNENLENFCTAIAVREHNTLKGYMTIACLKLMRIVLEACFCVDHTKVNSRWSKARETTAVLALRGCHLLADTSLGLEAAGHEVSAQVHGLALQALRTGIDDVVEEAAKYISVELNRSWDCNNNNQSEMGKLIQSIVDASSACVKNNTSNNNSNNNNNDDDKNNNNSTSSNPLMLHSSSTAEALFNLATLLVGVALPLHPLAVERVLVPWMLSHLRFAAHFEEDRFYFSGSSFSNLASSMASPSSSLFGQLQNNNNNNNKNDDNQQQSMASPTSNNNNNNNNNTSIRWSTVEQLLELVQTITNAASKTVREVFFASTDSSSHHTLSSSNDTNNNNITGGGNTLISLLLEVPSLVVLLILQWATHAHPVRANCLLSTLSCFAGSFSGNLRVAACEAVMDAQFLHWFEKTLLKETEVPVLSFDMNSPSSTVVSPQASFAGSPTSSPGMMMNSPGDRNNNNNNNNQHHSAPSGSSSPLFSPTTTTTTSTTQQTASAAAAQSNTNTNNNTNIINGPPPDSPFATRSELQLLWNSLDDPFGVNHKNAINNSSSGSAAAGAGGAVATSGSSSSQLRRAAATMGEPPEGPPPIETALLFLIAQLLPQIVERATVLFHIVPVHNFTMRYTGMTKDITIGTTMATELESHAMSGMDRFILSVRSETCYADLRYMKVSSIGSEYEHLSTVLAATSQQHWSPLRYAKLCPIRYAVTVDRGSLDHANALDHQQQQQQSASSSSSLSNNPIARRLQVQTRTKQRIEVESHEEYQMPVLSVVTTFLPIILNYFNFARSDVQRTLVTCSVSQLFKSKLRSSPFLLPVLETLKENFVQFFSDSFGLVENLLSIDRLLMACEGFCEFFPTDIHMMVERGVSDQIFALSRRLAEKLEQVKVSASDFMPSAGAQAASSTTRSRHQAASSSASAAVQQCEGVLARCYAVLIRLRQSQQQQQQQQTHPEKKTGDEKKNDHDDDSAGKQNKSNDNKNASLSSSSTSLNRPLFSTSGSNNGSNQQQQQQQPLNSRRRAIVDLKEKLEELNDINARSNGLITNQPESELKHESMVLTDLFNILASPEAQSLTNLELSDAGVVSSLISFIVPQIQLATAPDRTEQSHALRTMKTKKRIETFATIYGETHQKFKNAIAVVEDATNNNTTPPSEMNHNNNDSFFTPQKLQSKNNNTSSVFKKKPQKDKNVFIDFLAYEIDVNARSIRDRVPLVRKVFNDQLDNAEAASIFGDENTDGYVMEQASIEGHCKSLRGSMEAALGSGALFVGLAPADILNMMNEQMNDRATNGNAAGGIAVVSGSDDDNENSAEFASAAKVSKSASKKNNKNNNKNENSPEGQQSPSSSSLTASNLRRSQRQQQQRNSSQAANSHGNHNDDDNAAVVSEDAGGSTTADSEIAGTTDDDGQSSSTDSVARRTEEERELSSSEDEEDENDDDEYFTTDDEDSSFSSSNNNNQQNLQDAPHMLHPEKYLAVHWLASFGACLNNLETETFDLRSAIELSDPGWRYRAGNSNNNTNNRRMMMMNGGSEDNVHSNNNEINNNSNLRIDPVSFALEYLNQARDDSALSQLSLARAQHWSALDQKAAAAANNNNNRSSSGRTTTTTSTTENSNSTIPFNNSNSNNNNNNNRSRFEFTPPSYIVEEKHNQQHQQPRHLRTSRNNKNTTIITKTRVYRFEPAHTIAVKSGFATKRFTDELTIRETKNGSSRIQSLTVQVALDRSYASLPETSLGLTFDHSIPDSRGIHRNVNDTGASPLSSPAVALLRLLHTHGHLHKVPTCDVIDELALRAASASSLLIAQHPTTLACLPQWLSDLILYTPMLLSPHTRKRLAKFFLIGARRSFAKGLIGSRLNADRVLFDVVPVEVTVDEATAENAAQQSMSSHRHHHSTSTSSNRQQGHATRHILRVLRWPASAAAAPAPLTAGSLSSSSIIMQQQQQQQKHVDPGQTTTKKFTITLDDDEVDDDDDDDLGLVPTASLMKHKNSSNNSSTPTPITTTTTTTTDPNAWLDAEVSCESAIMQSAGDLLPASLAFEGDVGTGVGPSFQVLSSLAQSLATNQLSKIWRKTRESDDGSNYLLFPQVVRRDDPISIGRLRLVGAALARTWCDDRIFPLPLDAVLFEAMQGVIITAMDLPRRTPHTSSSFTILAQVCPPGLVKTMTTLQALAVDALELAAEVLPEVLASLGGDDESFAYNYYHQQQQSSCSGEELFRLCFDTVLRHERENNNSNKPAHEIKSTLDSLLLSNCIPGTEDVPVVGLDIDLELEVCHLPRYISVIHETITGLKLSSSVFGLPDSDDAVPSSPPSSPMVRSPVSSPGKKRRKNNIDDASFPQQQRHHHDPALYFFPRGQKSVRSDDVISGAQLVIDGFCEVAPLWPLLLQPEEDICREICGEQQQGSSSADGGTWTKEQVAAILLPDHGYNSSSQQIRWLSEVFSEISIKSQRGGIGSLNSLKSKLLAFITGCPVLPAGGLDAVGPVKVVMKLNTNALPPTSPFFQQQNSTTSGNSNNNNNGDNNNNNSPVLSSSSPSSVVVLTTPPKALMKKIDLDADDDDEVENGSATTNKKEEREEEMENENLDQLFVDEIKELGLPSVNTCVRYLKLPPYSRKEFLQKALLMAITDGNEGFELS